jgi:hypothetical protein
MKSYRRFHDSSWLLLLVLTAVSLFSAGCSSSSSSSGGNLNPMGAYQTTTPTGGLPVDGTVQNPGQINSPIVTIPTDGSGVNGHDNAPLLDNMHPGWQQASCLTCHNDTSRNPDHNYTDSSMCYLCHGTNGLPGFGDTIPPVLSGVVCTPTDKSAIITWKSDEECISRIVLRTLSGDRLEFPVSTTYKTSHRYEFLGLVAKTYYTYELICTDKSGNKTTSATFGTLSFTTLEKSTTTTTDTGSTSSGTDDNVVDTYFSGIVIEADGSFQAKIKFTIKTPSRCTAYFVRKETNTLAETMSLSAGQSITSYDGTLTGLQPNTEYVVFIEAREDGTNTARKSSNYNIKTDKFEN